MKFFRVGCVALLFSTTLISNSASACGLRELLFFEEKAQILEKDAEKSGIKLVHCPSEGREAYQWLAFLFTMRGEKNTVLWKNQGKEVGIRTKNPRDNSTFNSIVESEIDAAYAGSYEKLQRRIDSGNPIYVGNYEVQIAVGRALIRIGRFSEGRLYFDNAIRLGAHHGRFDVERLYTFIWEKNWELAEREIGKLRFDRENNELKMGINRAQELISSLKNVEAIDGQKAAGNAKSDGVFETKLSNFNISQEYRRYSASIGWHDGIDLDFTHHVISSLVYERDTKSLDTMWVGRDRFKYGMLRIGGKIGYRTPTIQNRFLFDGHIGLNFFEKFLVSVRMDRKNLAEILPLPRTSFDLVQDSVNGSISWDENIILQGTVAKDWNLPPFPRYKMNISTPLEIFGRQYGSVYGVFGTEYESRERPSPDYETFRQGLRTYLGGRVAKRFDSDTDINFELRYQNIHRQGHGMTNWVQNSALSIDLKGFHQLDPKWGLVGRVSYNGEETIRPTQPFQNRLEITLGAHLAR